MVYELLDATDASSSPRGRFDGGIGGIEGSWFCPCIVLLLVPLGAAAEKGDKVRERE